MILQLRLAWGYRYFILSSIRNELFVRFARSKLGGLWALINPLVMAAIYTLVLSKVLAAKVPGIEGTTGYAIYLLSGICAWNLFNDIVTQCMTLFTGKANLIKKMAFPKITLPLIVLGTGLANNVFLLAATIGIYLLIGHLPGYEILWIPVLQLVTAFAALGVGITAGVFNVFLRDIEQVVPVILQLLFWFTPIVYSSAVIPAKYHKFLELNPVYFVVSNFQDVMAFQHQPNIRSLAAALVIGLVAVLLGLFLVSRSSKEMADVL